MSLKTSATIRDADQALEALDATWEIRRQIHSLQGDQRSITMRLTKYAVQYCPEALTLNTRKLQRMLRSPKETG